MGKKSSLQDAIGSLPSDSQQKSELKSLKSRVKQLESLVDQQRDHIDRLHAAKFVIPRSKAARVRGCYYRVAVADTHGAKCSKEAVAAVLADLEAIRPSEVVLLGDHLDCGGFLAQHWTLGYVAETSYTFEDDVSATNTFLDRLQAACPNAGIHYLEGNHESRVEKFCVTQALRNSTDAKFLLDRLSPEVVLNLKSRGIKYYRRSTRYCGLAIGGTIKLGKCFFTHGERTGKYGTMRTLTDFAGCIVHGHNHTAAAATDTTIRDGLVGAWCPGCLCELAPLWRHTSPTDWSHGYGLQLVRPDQGFLHINVPIIDGKSYLVQLTEAVGVK